MIIGGSEREEEDEEEREANTPMRPCEEEREADKTNRAPHFPDLKANLKEHFRFPTPNSHSLNLSLLA